MLLGGKTDLSIPDTDLMETFHQVVSGIFKIFGMNLLIGFILASKV